MVRHMIPTALKAYLLPQSRLQCSLLHKTEFPISNEQTTSSRLRPFLTAWILRAFSDLGQPSVTTSEQAGSWPKFFRLRRSRIRPRATNSWKGSVCPKTRSIRLRRHRSAGTIHGALVGWSHSQEPHRASLTVPAILTIHVQDELPRVLRN